MEKRGPKTEVGLQAISDAAKQLDHTAWTKNEKAVQAIEVAKRMRSTKHGLYASVPILCKSDACPYAGSCPLMKMDLAPHGEKCPIEIAAIEDLFYRYTDEFSIDPEDRRNTVDLMMVKELVDIDVSLLRCDNKMAVDADFIIENAIGVSEDGQAITKQELHPLADYKEKLRNQKYKTYNLLNATRKDKEGTKLTVTLDPAQRAAEMIKVQQDMEQFSDEEEERKREYFSKFGGKYGGGGEVIDVEPLDFDDNKEE